MFLNEYLLSKAFLFSGLKMKVTEGAKIFKNQDRQDNSRLFSQGFYYNLMHPTHLKRFLFFLIFDSAIIVFSLCLSFFIRFEFTIPSEYRVLLLNVIPFFLLIKLTSFYCFKVYNLNLAPVKEKEGETIRSTSL